MPTPVISGRRLSLTEGDMLPDPSQYRSIVGALQYLTITRPDISFAVNQVCQFLHSPTTIHLVAVKRILRYLKLTYNRGLLYRPSPLKLQAFCDVDYEGDPDTRSLQVVIAFIWALILLIGVLRSNEITTRICGFGPHFYLCS